jgi:hypothetical protein
VRIDGRKERSLPDLSASATVTSALGFRSLLIIACRRGRLITATTWREAGG